jgi:uncharacterized protein (TIGR04255 family)
MAKRKQYKNPPLIEVFCEFSFQPDPNKEVDPLWVANFWRGRIKADFPRAVQPTGPPAPRHRFASENGKTLVQVSENLLVVNQLPPYYGWERFEPVVAECFEHYARGWKRVRGDRAAVHYVDKFDIPRLEFNLDGYFNLFPVLPEFPKKPATNIAVSYEVQGAQEGDVVVTTLRQYPSANPEGATFLIQWAYIATGGLETDTQQVRSWLGKAHDFLSELFLSTLTDECRKLFD